MCIGARYKQFVINVNIFKTLLKIIISSRSDIVQVF